MGRQRLLCSKKEHPQVNTSSRAFSELWFSGMLKGAFLKKVFRWVNNLGETWKVKQVRFIYSVAFHFATMNIQEVNSVFSKLTCQLSPSPQGATLETGVALENS